MADDPTLESVPEDADGTWEPEGFTHGPDDPGPVDGCCGEVTD